MEENSLVHPEAESSKTKIEINLQPVKRKRRFIYYGLVIFSSFIIARLTLIGVSFYSLNFDKLILNNIKYDSAKYDLFTVDVSLAGAYSALFIRIKDIDCDVFGVDDEGYEQRLFSLDIPDIEIVKYKTLRFIHDIKFKDVDWGEIVNCYGSGTVKIRIRCKLYYRFCLLNFFIKWQKDKVIEMGNDSQTIRWPKINTVHVESGDESLVISFDVDNKHIKFPPYVNAMLGGAHIRCTQNFPCSIYVSNQVVTGGKFEEPLNVKLVIDRNDYSRIEASLLDMCNKEKVVFEVDSITINKRKIPLEGLRTLYSICREVSTNKKRDERVQTNPVDGAKEEEPAGLLDNFWSVIEKIEFKGKELHVLTHCSLDWIPFLSPDTRFCFNGLGVNFKIKICDKFVGEGEVQLNTDGRILELDTRIKVLDLQGALDLLLNQDRVNYVIDFTDNSKKFSLLSGIKVEFDSREVKIWYKTHNHPFTFESKKRPNGFEIEHSLFSSHEKILLNSTVTFKAHKEETNKYGRPLLYVKNTRLQVDFENDFGTGSLFVKFNNLRYILANRFIGSFEFILELSPRMEVFRSSQGISKFIDTPIQVTTRDKELSFVYIPSTSTKKEKKKIALNYLGPTGLYDHRLKVKIPIPWSLKHHIRMSEGLIGINFYTKGTPLNDLRPNVSIRSIEFGQENELHFTVDLHLNPSVLKSLIYGEVAFFSLENMLSFMAAQYFNFLMEASGTEEMKTIISKEASLDIQLDGTDPVKVENRILNSYSGSVRFSLPREVCDSFIFSLADLPAARLAFHANNLLEKDKTLLEFRIEEEEDTLVFVCDLKINLEFLESKGQYLTYTIQNRSGFFKSTLTLPENSLTSFFRSFFVKMFELPSEETPSQKFGMFIAHNTIKSVQRGVLKTSAQVYLYSKSIEDFFTLTLPSIFAKCALGKVPKSFAFTLRSKRLDFLYLGLLSKGEEGLIKAYGEDIVSVNKWTMNYLGNFMVENSEREVKDNTFPPLIDLRDEIKHTKGRLVFHGSVVMDYFLPNEMNITGLKFDSLFPFFLASLLKEPSKKPLVAFLKAAFHDFAIEMPFSLEVESLHNVEYELFYEDKSIIRERILVDQGEDKFLHVCFQKVNHRNLLYLLSSIFTHEKKKFKIVFIQNQTQLIDFDFFLDSSIYDLVDFKRERLISSFSEKFKENLKKRKWGA